MRLHYRGEPFPLDALRKELTEAGAEFLDLTNEWEVLRYRYGGKVGILDHYLHTLKIVPPWREANPFLPPCG